MLETIIAVTMLLFTVFLALFLTAVLIYAFNSIMEKITSYSIADIVDNILQSITSSIMTIKRKQSK